MADKVTCPECGGRGYHTVPGKKALRVTCGRCKGSGEVPQ